MKNKGCLVLLSGGQDSAVTLACALKQFCEVQTIFIKYGQRHMVEEVASERIAAHYKVKRWVVVASNILTGENTALIDLNQSVGDNRSNGLPNTYVPARNLVFASIAVARANILGADVVALGVNAVDWSGYPDCTPEFFHYLQKAIYAGVVPPTTFYLPIIKKNKQEIIKIGNALNVPWSFTWTCYDPQFFSIGFRQTAFPCQECPACKIRAKAFADTQTTDPVVTDGLSLY